MTTTDELSSEEKVGLLRSLCQGYGMDKEVFVEKEAELHALVDADAKQIRRMFERAAEAMTRGKYKDAFLNALWARDHKNLTDRRTEFLAKAGDITYRTLVRHEQEGAEVFLKFLEAEARSSSSPYRIDEDEDDVNVDLQALRIRVAKLEAIMSTMHKVLTDANSLLYHVAIDNVDQDAVKRFLKVTSDYNAGADRNGDTMIDHIYGMPGYENLDFSWERPKS
ncbi:hypothetical protein AHiyo8_59530 [Arthrobacter sp. Hiyo8]|nr:hypothetical protein AHiyo8_59530 [Arthrobacter sp. Hiyo8]